MTIKSWTLALLASTCALGCAATTASTIPTMDMLRQRAAAAPSDPAAQRELALAELLHPHGEPKNAGPQLERALTLAPAHSRLLLARAIHEDVHGHPGRALDGYLATLEATKAGRDPLDPHIAELALLGIASLDGGVGGYKDKVQPALEELLGGTALGTPVRYVAGSILIELAYERGERPAAQAIAARIGCVTDLRAAGPFGPRELLSFDEQHAAKPGQPLADSYDLGPNRGVRATRTLGAKGCVVNVGGGPLAAGGSTYAQAKLTIAKSGDYVLRLQTASNTQLFLDGKQIVVLDTRKSLVPRVSFLALPLSAGTHELTVKLTTRHPNPAVAIAVMPQQASDLRAVASPVADQGDDFARYLRAAIALGRSDILQARASLKDVVADKPAAPLFRLQRASLFLSDPLLPGELREDEARQQLILASRGDEQLWGPVVQVASMMAGNGRTTEAIAVLRKAFNQWPEVPGVGLALASQLRDQQWTAEADAVIGKLRKRVPESCSVLSAEIEALRDRQREEQAAALIEPLMKCEAQANARYALLLRQRRWQEAAVELDRLQALEPPQNRYPWLLARLELAKNSGDEAGVDRLIEQLSREFPRSSTGAIEAIDRAAGRGDQKGALAILDGAYKRDPASMTDLVPLAPLLGGEHLMASFRRDGPAQIARFEASGHKYESPQVLVFDYMAVRVLPDLSSVSLVHSIEKAQSDEAVEDLAEVQVPDGAQVLTLRAIKPDGRRLEPDQIEGKETISLPGVTPGDYVETEYLLFQDPPEGFPNGYLGDRFYFKSFEIPFDHSEIAIALPEGLNAVVDPRGDAPKAQEEKRDGLRVWRFAVDQSAAVKPEPGSVSVREFLPSIRVGADATWPKLIDSIREALIDRGIDDPEVAELAMQIVGDAKPGDYDKRAQRLYDWVLENIEDSEDLFSHAAVMLRSRAGNRARILDYMLRQAGVPSQLVLARPVNNDSTPSQMADGDTYSHLLVVAGPKGKEHWLFTADRKAPFGYIPFGLRGQPALHLSAGAAATRVPSGSVGDELRHLSLEITLAPNGSAVVKAHETVKGSGAVAWRSNLESVPKAELEHRFEEEYVARLMPGARLRTLKIAGLERKDAAVQLDYEFELSTLGRQLGDRWALPPLLASELAQNYAQLERRTTTELIGNPLEIDVSVRIHLPKGSTRPALPQPVRLSAAVDGRPSFSMSTRVDDQGIVIERSLRVPVMRVTPEHYPTFASFCQAVDAAEAKELLVRLP